VYIRDCVLKSGVIHLLGIHSSILQKSAQYYDVATTAEGAGNCAKMDCIQLSLAIGASCVCLVSYDIVFACIEHLRDIELCEWVCELGMCTWARTTLPYHTSQIISIKHWLVIPGEF